MIVMQNEIMKKLLEQTKRETVSVAIVYKKSKNILLLDTW
jgi:hypothetical protein